MNIQRSSSSSASQKCHFCNNNANTGQNCCTICYKKGRKEAYDARCEQSRQQKKHEKPKQPIRHRRNLIVCCADGHEGCGSMLPLKYFEYYCSLEHSHCGNSGRRQVPRKYICDSDCEECN